MVAMVILLKSSTDICWGGMAGEKKLGNNGTLTKTSKKLDMCHRSYFSFAARQAIGKNQHA